MDIAKELLKATLAGIANGTVKPSLRQTARLEHAGLLSGGNLTGFGQIVAASAGPLDLALTCMPDAS